MRTTIAGIVLAAFAAAAPLAHAALEVESTGFSLGLTGGWYPDLTGFDMQLLSDSGGTVQIGLSGAGTLVNPVESIATEYDHLNGDHNWTQLGGKVKQGYRITSITLTSAFSGALHAGQPDAVCGSYCVSQAGIATNYGGTTLRVTSDGSVTTEVDLLENVTSPQILTGTVTRALDGDFTLDIDSILGAYTRAAQHTIYGDREIFWQSEGWVALDSMTMTVQIAAVPEPGTYAMLLAGLGLVGFAARRRR